MSAEGADEAKLIALVTHELARQEEDDAQFERLQINKEATTAIVKGIETKLGLTLEYVRTSDTKYADPDTEVIASQQGKSALLCGWVNCKPKKKKNWDRRYFVLQGGCLTYYTDESMQTEKGSFPLDACVVDGLKERENSDKPCLAIQTERETMYLEAETRRDNMAWFLAVNCMQQQVDYVNKMKASGRPPDKRIVAFFVEPMCHQLILDHNEITTEAVVAVLSSIRFHTVLHVLSLQQTSLGDLQLEVLCKALSRNKSLGILRLTTNNITQDGVACLANALASNTTIFELYLEDNQVGDDGAVLLADVLANHTPPLSVLALDMNGIGDTGCTAICESLSSRPHPMPKLSLSHNDISNGGAAAVGKVLATNPHVTSVDLSENMIEDAGVRALLELLPQSKAVKEINLSGNRATDGISRDVLAAVMHNRSVTRFEMDPILLDGSAIHMLRIMATTGAVEAEASS